MKRLAAASRHLVGPLFNRVAPASCVAEMTFCHDWRSMKRPPKASWATTDAHAVYFDLADQPIEVTMVVSTLDIKRLSRTCATKINVLYIQTPIDLGMTASDRDLHGNFYRLVLLGGTACRAHRHFAKIGIQGVDSDFATLIRTVIIIVVLSAFVGLTGKWTNP